MRLASLLVVALPLAACGGKVTGDDTSVDTDGGTYGRDGSVRSDGGNGYVDPRCPDASAPPQLNECDVFTGNGCGPGEGCYPAVLPPDQKCQSEVYGSFCLPEGSGTQGADCGNKGSCASGFVCLITGADTQCARLCELGKHACSQGFVCEPIDVPGYSACL